MVKMSSGWQIVRLGLASVGLAVLFACATAKTEDGRPLSEEPSYIAGFGDGCATATEAEKSFSTKRVRDNEAYDNDRAYRAGWRAGLLQCERDYDDATSVGGRILGEDQNY